MSMGILQTSATPVMSVRKLDRKSTRLNSSHTVISYAVFCLKKEEHTYELLSHRELVYHRLLQKKHHIVPSSHDEPHWEAITAGPASSRRRWLGCLSCRCTSR